MNKKSGVKILGGFLTLVILAGCGAAPGATRPQNDGGIWKSRDASGTWTQTVDVLAVKGQILRFPNENINSIVVDPIDHNSVFTGTLTSGLLFSYDAGSSWMQDKFHADKNIVSVAPHYYEKCRWMVASATRVYRTIDCGRGWREMLSESREGYRIKTLIADHFNRSVYYLAVGRDILKTTDYGDSWQTVARFKANITDMIMDRFDSRVILAGVSGNGIQKSVDGGQNWQDLSAALSDYKKATNVYSITQDISKRDTYVMANEYGLFRTINSGQSWTPFDLLTPPDAVDIRSIGVDPKSGDIIYYATDTTFYKTIDSGQSWKTTRLPSSRRPAVMRVNYGDGNVIYIGTTEIPQDRSNQLIR